MSRNRSHLVTPLLVAALVFPGARALAKDKDGPAPAFTETGLERAPGVSLGPYLQYTAPDAAVVRWETAVACATRLSLGAGDAPRSLIEEPAPKTVHSVALTELSLHTPYNYTIFAGDAESPVYNFDTTFNYTPVPVSAANPFAADAAQAACASAAAEILQRTGIDRGYCIVLGLGEGRLAYELAARSGLTVIGLDTDAAAVAAARQIFRKLGVLGTRIQVRHVDDLSNTGLTRNLANLVVSERLLLEGTLPGTMAEVARILRPDGGTALLGQSEGTLTVDALHTWAGEVALQHVPIDDLPGAWLHLERGPAPDSGSWTHQYGDTANTSSSTDTLDMAGSTDSMEVQWLGRPGADFGIDRNPRMPAPLAVNGRLFHQGLNKMIGLDAHNGTVLWLLEIPGLRRVNLPRDASNWCADEDFVYAAVQDRLWKIRADTGDVAAVFSLPEAYRDGNFEWGYIAQVGDTLYGSVAKKGSSYTDFWGGDAWYDQVMGDGTHKVCSTAAFAMDKATGDTRWVHADGAMINTTLTVGDDQRLYYITSHAPEAVDAPTGRVNSDKLWEQQQLVALDTAKGTPLWTQPIDTEDGVVVFFLTQVADRLVVLSSKQGKYHLYGYSTADAAQVWSMSHDWVSDNHGAHMQHPAIMNGVVYVEPRGYSAATGAIVTENMGKREGCATVAATKNALIYRGQARRVAMWDITTEKDSSWFNLRPSCWLSVVPGLGMVLAPEGGGGCSCGNWVETSLAFLPRTDHGATAPATTPEAN